MITIDLGKKTTLFAKSPNSGTSSPLSWSLIVSPVSSLYKPISLQGTVQLVDSTSSQPALYYSTGQLSLPLHFFSLTLPLSTPIQLSRFKSLPTTPTSLLYSDYLFTVALHTASNTIHLQSIDLNIDPVQIFNLSTLQENMDKRVKIVGACSLRKGVVVVFAVHSSVNDTTFYTAYADIKSSSYQGSTSWATVLSGYSYSYSTSHNCFCYEDKFYLSFDLPPAP